MCDWCRHVSKNTAHNKPPLPLFVKAVTKVLKLLLQQVQ